MHKAILKISVQVRHAVIHAFIQRHPAQVLRVLDSWLIHVKWARKEPGAETGQCAAARRSCCLVTPHTAAWHWARLPFRELGPLLCTFQVTLDDDQLTGHLRRDKHNTYTHRGPASCESGVVGWGMDPSAPRRPCLQIQPSPFPVDWREPALHQPMGGDQRLPPRKTRIVHYERAVSF